MKEKSGFYSSLSLLIVLNGIVKPVWIFAIDRQVQNVVGPEEYGLYFSILNLSIVLSFLTDWGLTTYYNRQLAANDEDFRAATAGFVFIKLLFGLLYAAIVLLIAYVTGISRMDIVVYVVLFQVLASMFVFFRAIVTAQQWFRTDAWLSVMDKGLMIVVCMPFLYFTTMSATMTIERFLLLQVGCIAFAAIVALIVLSTRKFTFRVKGLWPGPGVFKGALPFAIIVLLMCCHARIDGFLLERISGATEAGKYAAAYRLLEASNMAGYLVASFLLPFVARHQQQNDVTTNVILNTRHVLLVFAISLSTVVVFLAGWIQNTLYHHDDPGYAEVLQWCLPALVGYSIVQIYGTVLTATGHIIPFIYITLVSVVVNIAMNFALIPLYGAKGSCWAALCSQFFSALATIWYSRQKLRIPFEMRSFLIYIFIAGIICIVLSAGRGRAINNWTLIVIAAVLVLITLRITKVIDIRTWKISIRQ